MTAASKYIVAHYTGKSFSIEGKLFYPLRAPEAFILSINKTETLKSDVPHEVVAELDQRMEKEDVDLWLTEEGQVVTIMSNAAKTILVNLKHQFVAGILAHNGIYLNE